jgi:hypothetical protein
MSRLTVRNAIATYLNAANINYVGAVKPTRDYVDGANYDEHNLNGVISLISSSTGSGCVLIVNLTEDKRQRRALTGRGAVNDTNVHTVALELFFANTSGQVPAAQTDYDSIVDGVFEAIRADPTMGGALWSGGEYDPWIEHSQSAPYTDNSGTLVFVTGVVRWQAWEWLAGTGV